MRNCDKASPIGASAWRAASRLPMSMTISAPTMRASTCMNMAASASPSAAGFAACRSMTTCQNSRKRWTAAEVSSRPRVSSVLMATRYWVDACSTAAWKSASSSALDGGANHCAHSTISTAPIRAQRWRSQDAVMVALIASARLSSRCKPCRKIEEMSKLQLSVAVGNYDRVRPLMDGTVQIDGVDPVFMNLPPEEIFFRAFRSRDFDICELSMSSFAVKTAERNNPYVGVPAFVSRAFRHNSIYVRRDRIKAPADLRGKRVGLPEYQLTACVWARIILEDDHGIKPSDVIWVRGGIEDPGRPEKITIKLPAGVRMENAPDGATISGMLERG